MGAWERIRSAFLNETEEPVDVQPEDRGINDPTWQTCQAAVRMWQLQYALNVVAKRLATFFTDVEWDTYKNNKKIKGDEWFRFNVAPNRRQTPSEFYSKLAHCLVFDGEALIIETSSREFFIADSYSFKNGQELVMKDNTFVDVVVGTTTLNRSFKENDSCIYLKTPNYADVLAIFNQMANDFRDLKKLIEEGANKALGMKLSLNLSATAKNKYDEKTIARLQRIYEPLMNARNAVFITYKGEALDDLTEKQRGSEVQQVLEAVENNIKVNDELLQNVGSAFGIPKHFLDGEYQSENEEIYTMAVTMFAKPYLEWLSKKYTFYVLEKEDIINGSKIEANLDSIKYTNALMTATAVDKLIGSSAYSPNEVREMLGDDPFDGGDKRFITKNYAVYDDYVKGGDG